MKSHRLFTSILLGFCAILVSSCELPIPTPTATPGAGDCDPSQLVAPQAHSPSNELVSSLQPSIQWFYPEDCVPDSYRLEVAIEGDFNASSVIIQSIGGGQVPWTLTQSLQPNTLYQWRVAAEIGTSTSDYSPSLAFWTGPLCNASALNPPMLVGPAYGAIVQDDSPILSWEYSNYDCIPEGYHFEVASDLQFTNLKISGDGLGPWTSFETNVSYLDDCGLYYWWVAGQTGGVMGGHNLSLFYTDFTGSCSQFSCNSTQLVPPDPVYPINGEIVTDIGDPFRFQWQYLDPVCIPDGYFFEVYTGPDFASNPVGQGFALDSRVPGWGPLPELPSYVVLPDCMTYKWHVAALQGPEQGPFSSEATFMTNYANACATSSSRQVSLITMACLDDDQMMVTFEFPEDPEDSYEATVGGNLFACQLWSGAPQRLFCVGPKVQEGILAKVQLDNQINGEVVLTTEISILCGQEQPDDNDTPGASCGGLSLLACSSRADCEWIPGFTSIFAGHCEAK